MQFYTSGRLTDKWLLWNLHWNHADDFQLNYKREELVLLLWKELDLLSPLESLFNDNST